MWRLPKEKICFVLFFFLFTFIDAGFAAEEKTLKLPNNVHSIAKENTVVNNENEIEKVVATDETKQLLAELKYQITNPLLIQQLNESTIKTSPFALGYRGMIYLGRWPVDYQSKETTMNWEYQLVNTNEWNNQTGTEAQKLHYQQVHNKEVFGVLTSQIKQADMIKEMLLVAAKENTKLPLTYKMTIGQGTNKTNAYTVPARKYGALSTYVPAAHEKGEVTFADVYMELKGSDKKVILKNITNQEIAAWIPVKDYVTFTFHWVEGE